MIVNPLQTVKIRLPTQLVHGTVADNVEAAAITLKGTTEAVVIGNFFLSVFLNGVMEAMYSMINSL